jgi:hypothetical protein
LNGTGEAARVDEEFPEGFINIGAGGSMHSIHPGVCGTLIDEHEHEFGATRRRSWSVGDIHTNYGERFGCGTAFLIATPTATINELPNGDDVVTIVQNFKARANV